MSVLRLNLRVGLAATLVLSGSACGDNLAVPAGAQPSYAQTGNTGGDGRLKAPGAITFRSDVTPVTSVADAEPGVFIPPFLDCRDPKPGETGAGPKGKVCTNVAISGCTEPGKYFPDYGSCDVVRTQRPFWEEPPAKEPSPNDPRLQDAAYMRELGWVTEQISACACTCCHDARTFGGKFGQWDISHGPLWLDTLSNTGLALFTGLADSHVLGAYPADQNHGFDRSITGIPTTDSARMQAFMLAELQRRGLTREFAASVPPFGGPIYTESITPPTPCKPGEGVTSSGEVRWLQGKARYLYVLASGSQNPGVPPNLDTPEGTLWRLDVLASAAALESGVHYGTTPLGSFQSLPESTFAPALRPGQTYQLVVLQDVGLPVTNCLFVLGSADAEPTPLPAQPGASSPGPSSSTNDAGSAGEDAANKPCTLTSGDAQGFGAPCTADADCPCEADYCAIQPGQAGYCSKRGCKEDSSLCPAAWGCFDLSFVQAGLSVCTKP